jgi:hypothetical protein
MGRILRLLHPGRLISLEVQLVELLISKSRHVVMIQGKKLKNRRARNIGIRIGISQENHYELLFSRGF